MFRKGLVVLSGGQDSMTCFGVALKDCAEIMSISFNYGQKHAVELQAASQLSYRYSAQHLEIDLKPILQNMRSSALVTHGDTSEAHSILKGLPASFVPARNALFLTAAYGIAIEMDCDAIFTGVCQTDYSGYPDCRAEFIQALNDTLNIGYESNIPIITPLMYLTKAETFALAKSVDFLDEVLLNSITCYNGNDTLRNEWGLGCGGCPACKLRAKGWQEYKAREDARFQDSQGSQSG